MSADDATLVAAARACAASAYAPYSKFAVGAALLGESGTVYTGCNVENASYGLTICAERVALGKAVSEGERLFTVLAICVPGGGPPCGACRQALHEFAPGLRIVMADPEGVVVREATLPELLPGAFDPSHLDGPNR